MVFQTAHFPFQNRTLFSSVSEHKKMPCRRQPVCPKPISVFFFFFYSPTLFKSGSEKQNISNGTFASAINSIITILYLVILYEGHYRKVSGFILLHFSVILKLIFQGWAHLLETRTSLPIHASHSNSMCHARLFHPVWASDYSPSE